MGRSLDSSLERQSVCICDEDGKNAASYKLPPPPTAFISSTAWKSMTDMVADKAKEQWESDPACLNERIKQMKLFEARIAVIPLVYALVNLASQI